MLKSTNSFAKNKTIDLHIARELFPENDDGQIKRQKSKTKVVRELFPVDIANVVVPNISYVVVSFENEMDID